MFRRRATKTKPKKIHEVNGIRMKSKPETVFALAMTTLGIEWVYEPEKIPYSLPGRRYTPDFLIKTKAGWIYIEFKGWLRPEDRTKLIAVRDQHPEMDLRIVFANASKKISKNSPTTYGAWATKHGFQWGDKSIPPEWLIEEKINERM